MWETIKTILFLWVATLSGWILLVNAGLANSLVDTENHLIGEQLGAGERAFSVKCDKTV